MNNYTVKEQYLEKSIHLPSVHSLLKISLGLILFVTVISTALAYAETMSVDVDGTSFNVEYAVTGMTVSGIKADTDFTSLILTVDVTDSSGTLDITFDRSFFDNLVNGLDEDFFILVDGDEVNFSETETSSESRTLNIELPVGTEEIEIIGSVFGESSGIDMDDDSAAADQAAADQAAADQAAADQAAADQAAADQAAADQAAADQAAADQAAADQAAADQAAADQASQTISPCGPGTILKDDECVLDERCGPGTILKDDECVLDERCGPGTILKDDECVLDERCGPGTILKDDECVIDSTSHSSDFSAGEMGKELVISLIVAFIIAGLVGILLILISKASKKN